MKSCIHKPQEYDGCGLNYVPAKKPTLLEKVGENEFHINPFAPSIAAAGE